MLTGDKMKLSTLLGSKEGQAVLHLRRLETEAYTAALSVESCSHFAPVIRLPPVINNIRAELRELRQSVRSPSEQRRNRRHKQFKSIQEKLSQDAPTAFLERIDRPDASIRIIADLPLEWLPIRGLPLCLNSNLTRIPVTPGNLLLKSCFKQVSVNLKWEDFSEVLIIRALRMDDPLYDVLKNSLHRFDEKKHHASDGPVASIRWRDVTTKDDFIHAINEFDGALLVFDGHGSHSDWWDEGELQIGHERVKMWEIAPFLKNVPPIVLLAACDTHPADTSHSSTANAFLAAGAIAVLASLLPLDGIGAAMLMARMIFRLRKFIGILTAMDGYVIKWTAAVSGMLRMAHVSEILQVLRDGGVVNIDDEQYYNLHRAANIAITSNMPGWYELFVEHLAAEAGISTLDMHRIIEERAALTDAMMYVNVGNPDRIIISK
jgi:hypothetical protein